MNRLADYWQNTVQAQRDEENAQLNEAYQDKPEPPKENKIRLEIWAGEFTFSDGEKEVTGKINGRFNELYSRAVEVAKERKARLVVVNGYKTCPAYCKDFRE
jgi:hypothetical protein